MLVSVPTGPEISTGNHAAKDATKTANCGALEFCGSVAFVGPTEDCAETDASKQKGNHTARSSFSNEERILRWKYSRESE